MKNHSTATPRSMAPCSVSDMQITAIRDINDYRRPGHTDAIIVGKAMVELQGLTPPKDFACIVKWGCGLKRTSMDRYLRIGKSFGHLRDSREVRKAKSTQVLDVLFSSGACPSCGAER